MRAALAENVSRAHASLFHDAPAAASSFQDPSNHPTRLRALLVWHSSPTMPQLFIADSEDEGGDDFPLPQSPVEEPASNAHAGPAPQSSEGVSAPTASTDIAFFESILNEQSAAAREHVRTASTKATGAVRVDDAWDVPSSPDVKPSSGRRKRRKVSHEGVTSPKQSGFSIADESSSVLPPTLPPPGEPALVINPIFWSKSEQTQPRDGDNYPSSVGYDQTTTLLQPAQRVMDIGSSSSATNLNTPRSGDPLAGNANTQDQALNGFHTQTTQPTATAQVRPLSTRQRRESSPDVIAVAQMTRLRRKSRNTKAESDEEPADEERAGEEDAAYDDPASHEDDRKAAPNQDGDEPESAFEASPVKPKKRGRPKKVKDKVKVVVMTESKEEAEPPKTKRKRGRPKKTKVPPADEATSLVALELPVVVDIPDDEKAATEPVVPEDVEGVVDEPPAEASGEELKEEKTRHSPDEMAEELTRPSTKTVKQSCKDEDVKKPLSSMLDKPLYRVGLSKRSRIAPLLKVIRK